MKLSLPSGAIWNSGDEMITAEKKHLNPIFARSESDAFSFPAASELLLAHLFEIGDQMRTQLSRSLLSALTVLMLTLQLVVHANAQAQVQTGPIVPLQPPAGIGLTAPMTGDLREPNNLRHRDALGRPCLDITAESRAQPSTPNIYQHILAVSNRCLQRIRIKLCYYKSDRCFLSEIPGNQRKETILGTFPSMKYFRYEFQEQY